MTPLQFTRNVRSLNRLRQIAQVLTRHGFGHVVAQIDLSRFVPVWMLRSRRRDRTVEAGPAAIGRRLVAVFNELGPTFIKLGQVLSTRPDLIPDETIAELRHLQDKVSPFDVEVAKKIVEEELGRSLGSLFSWFDETPLASASIAQVHAARLHDGTEVVLKIRRPDIENTIHRDVELLRWMADSLEHLIPESRPYRPSMIVAELDEMLGREVDFVNEAATTSRMAKALVDVPHLRVPRVHWKLSGSRVLTLQRLPGVNLDEALAGAEPDAAPYDRKRIARRLADAMLDQIFDIGTFHADPHPGNILLEAPDRISLLDFGEVGVVSDELMAELVTLLYGCVNSEMELVIDTLADMGAVTSDTDRRSLARSLHVLLNKYHGLPLHRVDVGRLLTEFAALIRRHDVVVPRDVSMLIKAVGTVGGVIRHVDPDLNLLELLTPRVKAQLRREFAPGNIGRRATLVGWDLLTVLRKAPGQLRTVMRRASTGGWQLRVRHENIDRLVRELDRSSNRLAFSVVIAAIIVGSSVVVSAQTSLTLFGLKVQYLGIAGYLLAGVLGLGLSWAIFRSGRLH